MRLMANGEYWRDREAKQRETYIRTEDEELAEINRIYNDMYRWAEREINAFYGKYASAEGIDITEAKKRVSKLDIEEYERLAKEYVKDKDFSDRANAEMRLYNATMKINRLELLKAMIGLKLVDGTNDIDKHWEKIATDRATQEIIRQSGILGKTLTDTEVTKTAKQIVNADFYNANFSERIWAHMDNLRSELAIELQKGLIAGIGSRQMATNLRKKFDVSVRDAHRLARTELRRIQTDVAKDNYERNGFDEYEFMAVNPRACPICRELDGQIFKVKDMKPGENAPPIHPNCHCTTAPHMNEDDYNAWLNYLEQGGTTTQWDQMSPTERQSWYDKIVQSIPKTDTPNADAFTRLNSADVTDKSYKALLSKAETLVGYRQITQLQKAETEKERIEVISGGDRTKGSCASLGLCYIGRKMGWDVLDFRGGASQDFFSNGFNLVTLSDAKGIKKLLAQGKSELTVGNRLLKQCEEGKEYYLCCGRHASIVRKHNDKLQYLELQSADRSGWTDFNGNPRFTLHSRFGASSTSSSIADKSNFMIDLQESDFDTDEFRTLLGYINTSASEQRKGAHGTIK